MQPTDESLKIAQGIINEIGLAGIGSYTVGWLTNRIALALDAAYQRGKDEVTKERDAALALAAQRGDALLELMPQNYGVGWSRIDPHHFVNIIHEALDGDAPEQWLQKEIAWEKSLELDEFASSLLRECTQHITPFDLMQRAAAIRKEAGL